LHVADMSAESLGGLVHWLLQNSCGNGHRSHSVGRVIVQTGAVLKTALASTSDLRGTSDQETGTGIPYREVGPS